MTIFLCFLCLLLIFIVSLIFLEYLKPSKRKLPPGLENLPPGPKELPIIGILHNFDGLFHLCLRSLSQKYGPVMLIPFGSASLVVISSKEAAEEDLEGCSRAETVGSGIFAYNFKDAGFAPDGEDRETSRNLALLELFKTKIQSFRYIREEESDLLVKKLAEYASRRSPVNLTKTLFTLVSSMVCRVMSGKNLQECKFIDEDSIADLVHKFDLFTEFSSFSDLFSKGFGWLINRIFGLNERSKKVFSELDTFFQNIIDDHLKPGRTVLENPDIIDVMIDMMKKQEEDEDSFKLTTEYLKGIITDMFLAEVNTSVIALVWAMTELIRNPRVLKKVQDEIRTALGGKKERITEDDLNQLGYLKLVVKETFRLHPPVPNLPHRETLSRVEKIQGYDIPEEAMIMINVYAIARDPKLWTNPDEFNPDRFLDSSIDYRGLDFELLPFGSGQKICPEMRMATVELGLLNLLYFFDWGLPLGKTIKDIGLEETGVITLSKKAALELVPILHH